VGVAAYARELAALLAERRRVALREALSVVLYDEDELGDAQLGYGVDADGNDLSSEAPGAWQPAWLVVAEDEETGTPLVADLAVAGFPVLALARVRDAWEPDLAAESFAAFARALEAVATAEKALDEEERDRLLGLVLAESPNASLVFWEELLEG
jgi:hypothetical protein